MTAALEIACRRAMADAIVADMTGRPDAAACYRTALAASVEGHGGHGGSDVIDAGTALAALLALARLEPELSAAHLATAAALAGPEHPQVAAGEARVALAAGRHALARALADSLEASPDPTALLVAAEVACAIGPPETAVRRVDRLGQHAAEHALDSFLVHACLLAAQLTASPDERAGCLHRAFALTHSVT